MIKRITTLVFVFLTIVGNAVWGQNVWDGTIATQFAGGSGTEEDPYQISNGAELAFLAQEVNNGNSTYNAAYYILTYDITLNSGSCEDWETNAPQNEWTPIGFYDPDSRNNYSFQGSFDGNGKTISGMYIDGEDKSSLGLFGYCSKRDNSPKSIKNIHVENSYIEGGKSNTRIGGIVAYLDGSSYSYTISDCSMDGIIKASVANTASPTEYYVSGICGCSYLGLSSEIVSCHNNADITVSLNGLTTIEGTSSFAQATYSINGIGAVGEISNSYNTGNISVTANKVVTSISTSDNTLFGVNVSGIGNSSKIVSCYNLGNITVSGGEGDNANEAMISVGGISANISNSRFSSASIQYCYNKRNINSTVRNGGTIEYLKVTVGSLIGNVNNTENEEIFSKNCYVATEGLSAIGSSEEEENAELIKVQEEDFTNGRVACLLREGGYGQNLDNSGSTPFLTNAEEDKVYSLTLKDSEDDSEPQIIYANSGESIELMDDTEFGNITEGYSLVGKTDEGKAMSLGQSLESLDRDLVLTLEKTTDTYYAVKVQETDGVTVVRDANFAKEGETVKITTEIAEDYALSTENLKVTTNTNEPVTVTSVDGGNNAYTFTMPTSDVTVEALATSTLKPYTISLRIKYRDYDERAKIEASQTTANAGEEITLTITLPHDQLPHKIVSFETEGINPSDLENTNDKTGYYLIGEDVFTYKFTMPAKNVSIDAFADRCVGLDIETDGNGWLEMITRTAHETDEVVSIRSSVENNKNTFYGYGSEGELVTLRIHPNPGYEVDEISLHNYYYEHDDVEDIWDFPDDWKEIVKVTGEGNNYTFNIPSGQWKFSAVYGTITFKEATDEQPGDDDEEDQGDTGIHKPQRPIKYYNIYIDTICPGLEVEVSKDVVQEGHQVSAYLTIQSECDTTGMRFEYKRGLFGYWQDLKVLEGVQPGEYIIKNIYTDIYIRALDATLPEEEPTGIEDLEGVKAYAKDGSIYVYTPSREEVTIIGMSGAIIKHAEQIGLQSYNVSRGIYIVRIGEKVFKLKN